MDWLMHCLCVLIDLDLKQSMFHSLRLCTPVCLTSQVVCGLLLKIIHWEIAGSGKTYTMQPLPLRACEDIMAIMHQPSHRNQGLQLWLSFFEIYGGKLYDLLNERRCVWTQTIWLLLIYLVCLGKLLGFTQDSYLESCSKYAFIDISRS